MDNSASVRAVDSRNLSSSFGPGIRLQRITVSVTDDPVTYTIKSRLKWLGDYPEPSLKQGHALDARSIAAVIHHGDLIQRRSDERGVGKERVSTWKSRWS